MPITKSAKKAVRGSARKRVGNDSRRRKVKDLIKRIEKLGRSDKKEAAKLLPAVFQAIDKAAKAGVLKKRNAARKKSRLARLLK